MRGSLEAAGSGGDAAGSIPACAGEPGHPRESVTADKVDPRVCGGAHRIAGRPASHSGRSPRVRGSQVHQLPAPGLLGSIPACAGEPPPARFAGAARGVDPRVCGGAVVAAELSPMAMGRSPRVRGSQRRNIGILLYCGSIPACAGEPRDGRACVIPIWVDPRVCGGALECVIRPVTAPGRSPRVRGSRAPESVDGLSFGSIPACAGEPIVRCVSSAVIAVDPRVCGGAAILPDCRAWPPGRSPRVRGSPKTTGAWPSNAGSIPACAGEPCARYYPFRQIRVDPRVCGGAQVIAFAREREEGRSPRVRGSRQNQPDFACR